MAVMIIHVGLSKEIHAIAFYAIMVCFAFLYVVTILFVFLQLIEVLQVRVGIFSHLYFVLFVLVQYKMEDTT